MPKQLYVINDFSKGMNNLKDPRDIEENEVVMAQNLSIESKGKIKTAGGFYGHGVGNDGTGSIGNGKYTSDKDNINIVGAGGYGLFYFESDHSPDADETLSLTTSNGTNADGEIAFYQPSTAVSSGFTLPSAPSDEEPTYEGPGGGSGGAN